MQSNKKEYLQHIASQGDRWDSLSYQYYGDATDYERIITANSDMAITTTLAAGAIVLIPIIDEIQAQPTIAAVPFWLRAGSEADDD